MFQEIATEREPIGAVFREGKMDFSKRERTDEISFAADTDEAEDKMDGELVNSLNR